MGMICDCEPFEVCPSCAPSWRGVEIKPAPCQHNHGVVVGGEVACFDCKQVIAPSVEVSRRYTLEEIWDLMKTFIAELDKKSGQYNTMRRLELSAFHAWLAKREKELRR